jgi:hypothetical protein
MTRGYHRARSCDPEVLTGGARVLVARPVTARLKRSRVPARTPARRAGWTRPPHLYPSIRRSPGSETRTPCLWMHWLPRHRGSDALRTNRWQRRAASHARLRATDGSDGFWLGGRETLLFNGSRTSRLICYGPSPERPLIAKPARPQLEAISVSPLTVGLAQNVRSMTIKP